MTIDACRTIGTVLDDALAERPDAPAVEAASGVWTYRALDEHADRAAGALWALGVRPGDRVACCLPNDLDIVAAFHGSQRLGAIWVGIGEALTAPEQAEMVELCAPKVLVAGDRYRASAQGTVSIGRWRNMLTVAEPAPPVEIDLDAPAAIAFTSGTSGHPRAVVHSQRNLLLPGMVLTATRGWSAELRKGDSFPLTILNLMVLSTLLTAQCGGCAVLMNRRDVDGVVEWITTRRITVWNGAPAQLYDLARRPELDLGALQEVWSGGGDTSAELRRTFADAHGIVPSVTYGLTEAPTVVSIDPPGGDIRGNASGQVLPHLDVAAYAEDGRRLPPGEVGELRLTATDNGQWAHAWHPMLGHWENGAVTPTPPGPLATGDIGSVEDDGWLTVVDRQKLVIVRGGANVYPQEIERVIAAAPGVSRVAVYAVPDERLGQRVAAVVESNRPSMDFRVLDDLCRRRLAAYKVPEFWSRVDALPVNSMGKVVRSGLAAHVAATTTGRPR